MHQAVLPLFCGKRCYIAHFLCFVSLAEETFYQTEVQSQVCNTCTAYKLNLALSRKIKLSQAARAIGYSKHSSKHCITAIVLFQTVPSWKLRRRTQTNRLQWNLTLAKIYMVHKNVDICEKQLCIQFSM